MRLENNKHHNICVRVVGEAWAVGGQSKADFETAGFVTRKVGDIAYIVISGSTN